MRKIARITNPAVAIARRHLRHATLVQEFWLRYQFVFFCGFGGCAGAMALRQVRGAEL
jgi:hypothetical protein